MSKTKCWKLRKRFQSIFHLLEFKLSCCLYFYRLFLSFTHFGHFRILCFDLKYRYLNLYDLDSQLMSLPFLPSPFLLGAGAASEQLRSCLSAMNTPTRYTQKISILFDSLYYKSIFNLLQVKLELKLENLSFKRSNH